MQIVSLNELSHYLRKLVENRLWLKVIIALILGVGAGILLSPATGIVPEKTSASISNWLGLPGQLFLGLVQMIMIPLILTSIISGVASNSMAQLKTLGVRAFLYFFGTTVVSVVIGVGLAKWLKPGASIFASGAFRLPDDLISADTGETVLDVPSAISGLLPSNPLADMVSGEMLSVVIFAVIVGVAILQLKEAGSTKILTDLLFAVQEICMTVVSWAMRLVPYAVFGMIAQLTATVGMDSITGLGYYMLVVLLGLLILLSFYMLIVSLLGRKNPITFLSKIKDVQLLAFSTTSSAAVMPLSMKTADEQLGVSSKVSDFIIPIGATINMDGTAIYQCISTLFIAQAYGMELSLVNTVLIVTTIVAASIGTPAIPGGGVVVLASVLQSAGIPAEGLVIIIGVDRILGMFRTAINVTGDLTACVVFDRWLAKTG